MWQSTRVMRATVLLWSVFGAGCLAPDGFVPDAGSPIPAQQGALALAAGRGGLDLPVPPDAVSAVVRIHGVPRDVRLWVAGWEGPDGVVLLGVDAGRLLSAAELEWTQDTGLGLAGPCRTRPGFSEATAGCSTAASPLFGPGAHRLNVVAAHHPDGGAFDGVAAWTAQFSRVPQGSRRLPIRLHFSAATQAGNPQPLRHPGVATLLDTTATLLRRADVVLDVEGFAAPRDEVVLDGVTLRSDALWDLVAVMPSNPGVDVFVLGTLLVTGGDGVMRNVPALSTSVPLAAGEGSVAGMILMRGDFSNGTLESPQLLGTRLAHELGHALGLFHPLEFPAGDGSAVEDTLLDTTNNPLDAPDLLMHHTPLTSSTLLTPQQVDVIRQSPILR
jgi:hypothetical protein